MAKNMALVEDGVITNILWCSGDEPETETLIDMNDSPAGVGDTYENGRFYRDGVKILTPLEEARKQIEDYNALVAELSGVYESVEQ